jgi:hypothetical protein
MWRKGTIPAEESGGFEGLIALRKSRGYGHLQGAQASLTSQSSVVFGTVILFSGRPLSALATQSPPQASYVILLYRGRLDFTLIIVSIRSLPVELTCKVYCSLALLTGE